MRCVLGFLAICILAGCSTSADQVADSDDQEVVGATKVIEAQLRTDPRAVVDASCDRYTALSLSKTRDGKLYLELENKLAGTCEIAIVPDKRSYGVVQSSDGCGSTLYKGTRGADSVTLQDNRARICEDLRPATLELSEQRGTSTVALYGAPIAGGNGSAGAGADAQLLDVKLYDEPHAQVNPSCDMYTHLGLKRDGAAISASVEFKLSATSTCEPYVAPNERTFGVTQSDDGCGSKVYTGTSGADRIVITDNTHRLCEDLRPARIEVDLTRDGQTSHLFSPE